MGRAPCCDKTKVKKGPWSPEEDAKLKSYIDKHGTGGNWIALPQKIGLKRCGKSCRLRWLNYLRPNIKHGGFSEEEDNIICSLYINIGSRWSIIAAQLPGRTDNDIKNYWNTRLKKKLLGRQRKEQQAQNRRAAASLKQEMKRSSTTTSFHLPPETFVNQSNPYWAPELPMAAVLPVMSYQTHDTQVFDYHQQASNKNMLLKLGGIFSDTTNSMYPIDHISSTSSDQFYQTSTIDQMLTFSPPANRNYAQLGQSTTPAMFHGVDRQSNPEADLSELVYGNSHPHQQLDGLLAGFYQMENLNNGSIAGTSTSAESEISWGDINSDPWFSTTAPIVSDYENNCQQDVRPPDSAFAESTCFGLK